MASMECNKDDALKAKELAEEKLLKKDYGGAWIFAIKARDLDPNLVDLPPLLAAIEVSISAERRVNGQVDWYGVLGAQPLADDATIRRCYRTRVLMLHPDKNKSVGAVEAFKLITQAWSLLSDKDKKSIYDQNLISRGRYEKIPGGEPSVPAHQNGFCNNNNNIFNTANCKDRDQRNGTLPIPTPVSPVTLEQTFWSRCHSCNIQFEYDTVYINCKIICFCCHQPFLAHEAPPPPLYRNDSSTSRNSQMKQHNFSSTRIERNCHASGRNPMYAVDSSLESSHFSMPCGISTVPTAMYAVNSSLESGHFFIPGKYEDIPGGKPSVPAYQNGFCTNNNIFNAANCKDRDHRNGTHSIPTPVSPVTLKRTFWTRCHSCNTQFKYHTVFINCKIFCFSCCQPFLAHEAPPPPVYRNDSSTSSISQMKQHNFNSTRFEGSCHASGRTPMYAVNSSLGSVHFSMPGGISTVPTPASAAVEAPGVYGMSSENLKRWREDSTPIIREEGHFGKTHAVVKDDSGSAFKSSWFDPDSVQVGDSSRKIRRTDGNQVHGDGRDMLTKIANQNGGICSAFKTPASAAVEAPGVYGMSSENLKRRREDSTPIIREEGHFGKTHAVVKDDSGSAFKSSWFDPNSVQVGDSSRKIRRTDGNQVHGDGRDMLTKIANQNGGIRLPNKFRSQKDNLDTGRVNAAGIYKRNGTRGVSQLQMKNMLMEKARKEIRKKLDELKASSIPRNLEKPKNTIAEDRAKNKERAVSGVKHAAPEFVDSETIGNKLYSAVSEVTETLTMSVPDPDFHDFDGDRTENAFGENQIWATYDNDDGMPRFYALIHNVISKKHFNVKISWLSSKTNDELAPIKWVGAGFAKTVGDLRIGKRGDFSTTLNSFSHRVKWTKGSRGLIHIYPQKGDVWALYRNWSVEWNEFTKNEVVHKYDTVEVLDDFSEEQGVNVAPLAKVAGFKTVFRRNADPRKIMNIPKVEMFRFSHQVPSYLLTGQEGPNAPSGCLELDPAALPKELLQTGIETPDVEMIAEKPSEEEPKPNMTFREAAVEDVPRKEVADAKERKEGRPEVVIVYKRKRFKRMNKSQI